MPDSQSGGGGFDSPWRYVSDIEVQVEELRQESLEEAIKPAFEEERELKHFRVVLEQVNEEVIEVEAYSEDEAVDLAINGEGVLVDGISFAPSLIATGEIDG